MRKEALEECKRWLEWAILDGYYVPTRYPNALPDSIPAKIYTKNAAKSATKLAQNIVSFVKRKVQL